ncbi:MAG: RodZ domain-containing protein [Acidobacteriota bacterium]|nr:RodZ domain-containing protein [Acidobacteriota bacterium]
MNQQKREEERKPRPWEQEPEGAADSFGGWLRRQREMRDMSLREISDVTKIGLRYLEALEQNRFSTLPAPVFARGFLRQYAKYVGLDPDEVVNYFIVAQHDDDSEGQPQRRRRLHSTTHWAYGLVLTGAVVGLFGVVALLAFWAERRSPRAAEPPPIAAPVFSAPAVPSLRSEPVREATAPLEVTLDFTQTCWVEALVDNRDRISELRVQGESLRLQARESVSLTLGNAAGVRIEVNGQPFEIAGQGDSVRDLQITLDSLAAGGPAARGSGL